MTLPGEAWPQVLEPMISDDAAGWYGKIPATGDFLGRRLPPEFVVPWDRWLQEGIAHSRALLGDRWLEIFVTFPVWRFILPRGVLGDDGWYGVMIPSMDRVGRYFPLTVCRRLDPAMGSSLLLIEEHLAHFAHAALQALENEPAETFDARVAAAVPPQIADSGPCIALDAFTRGDAQGHWPVTGPLDALLLHSAQRTMLGNLGHRCLWWFPATDGVAGELRLSQAPLSAELFTTLISGS